MRQDYGFVDVLSFDPEVMAAILPEIHQARSLIFLYPLSTAKCAGSDSIEHTSIVFFLKQTIENACGSIALIHALANNQDLLAEGLASQFFRGIDGLDAERRGKALEGNEQIAALHSSLASEGQTEAPDATADTDLHFIAFVAVNGNLYELDGRKAGPVHCCPITGSFFAACAETIQKDYLSAQEDGQFTAMALIPTSDL